jgi:nucleoside-diphosphate-sugar epimerase
MEQKAKKTLIKRNRKFPLNKGGRGLFFMPKYLVTGGAGFIGSHIVEELLNRGEFVRILDNFSTGRRQNISPFIDNPNFELIEGDLRSYHIVREAVKGIDYVLHEGALPSVPRSVKDPITTNDINVNGTLNILDASINAGVKRVIFASSSSIYGNGEELPKREDMKPAPESPYAISKYAGERYCQIFTKLYGLETVCLRYFNVFGPRQDPNSQYSAVIPKFIQLIKEGQSPIIYGDGEASRDFTYVANVVNANLLSCTAKDAVGEVFNIACGVGVTINQLVKKITDLCGNNIKPIYKDPRLGDVKHSYASIEKAKARLGYSAMISFDEGLIRVANS